MRRARAALATAAVVVVAGLAVAASRGGEGPSDAGAPSSASRTSVSTPSTTSAAPTSHAPPTTAPATTTVVPTTVVPTTGPPATALPATDGTVDPTAPAPAAEAGTDDPCAAADRPTLAPPFAPDGPTPAVGRWVAAADLAGSCAATSGEFTTAGIDARLRYRSDATSFVVYVVDAAQGRDATAGFADGECAGPCREVQLLTAPAGRHRLEVEADGGPWEVWLDEFHLGSSGRPAAGSAS